VIVGHIDLYPTVLDLLALPKPAQQQMDGVSYARVLKSGGGLDRKAFFNYFPHGSGPGRAGGVWVRSGDWKLLRWFGVLPGEEGRYELYNLREDLSEATNLAAKEAGRVKEMDALIDGFLAETGATFPRPNPAYKVALARTGKVKGADDPLEGWKARQCEAVVANGVLTMTSKGQPGAAFLGHAMGTLLSPVAVKMRVRSAAGGAGKVEWLGDAAAGAEPKSVAFTVPPGGWQELTVEVPANGLLGTTRLYLPAHSAAVELDWVELTSKDRKAKPQRWDFESK
jgi:hypothetical protein